MKNDPFNTRPYWVQQNEPEPSKVPVEGGHRYRRFNVGDWVYVPVSLPGFPLAGTYCIRQVHTDPVTNRFPGSGIATARYDLHGQDLPVYDENLVRRDAEHTHRFATLRKAEAFARHYHYGQIRRGGEPYMLHLSRVAAGARKLALYRTQDEYYKVGVAAWLHDIVEDRHSTVLEIAHEFGIEVANIVRALTHKQDESYEAYIDRVAGDSLAKIIKISDLLDNLADNPKPGKVPVYAAALRRLLLE